MEQQVAATDSADALETAEQPVSESSADSAPSQPDRDDQTRASEDASDTGKEPTERGGIKERIGKLVRSRAEAEQRAAEAERRAAELEARLKSGGQADQSTDAAKAPKQEDFQSYDDWAAAHATYTAEQAASKYLREQQERTAQEARERSVQQEHAQRVVQFQTGVEALAAELPDVEQLMHSTTMNPQTTGQALLRSSKGAEVLYYLGNHPAELAALEARVGNDVFAAAMEIGRLEGKAAEYIKSRTQSRAPRQSDPVRAGGRTNSTDPRDARSMDDYARLWRKQRYGK